MTDTIDAKDIKSVTVDDNNGVNNTPTANNTTIDATNKYNKVSKDSANLTQNLTKTVANLPSMQPDWTNRRRLIFSTMQFIGACMGGIVVTVCGSIIWETFSGNHGQLDGNLVNLAQTIIYVFSFLAGSVIGAYCFGAAYEYTTFSSNIINMASKVATAGGDNKDKDKDKDKDKEDRDK